MAVVKRQGAGEPTGLAYETYLTPVGSYSPSESHIVRRGEVAGVDDDDPIRIRHRGNAH